MAHESIHTIRSFYKAFARLDDQLLIELLDPQIEWNSAENFLYADQSPYVGVDTVLELFKRLFADWDHFSMSPGEILGSGEIVIASGRFRGTYRANGAPINAQFVQVFQFKSGRISKCQVYTDTAQFKEAISRIRSASA
jgi:ketosteroid isomerase-like protein